jgi:hypothetical protein
MGIVDRIKAMLRGEDEEIVHEAQETSAPEAERLQAEREDIEGAQADQVAEDELRDPPGGARPM